MRPQVALLDDVFAAGLVKDYSLAVDGGANVGDWTAKLLEQFECVYAIDAAQVCVDFLDERFPPGMGVKITHAALLSGAARVRVVSPNKKPFSQKRYVAFDDSGDTMGFTIDSLKLKSCGLIKLDLEGAEGLALLGARETIAKFRPVLIVEFFREQSRRYGHSENDVLNIVRSFGYREALSSYPDKVFVHGD